MPSCEKKEWTTRETMFPIYLLQLSPVPIFRSVSILQSKGEKSLARFPWWICLTVAGVFDRLSHLSLQSWPSGG